MREALLEAIRSAKQDANKRKFRQSVELQLSFKGIDPRKPQERITGEVVLPHDDRERKICVIAEKEAAVRAKEAGADLVLSLEEVEKISSNKKEAKKLVNGYDFFLAQPDLLTSVAKMLGKYLGPQGKIPKPLPQADLRSFFERLRKTVTVRMRSQPVLALRIGSESMSDEQLADNAEKVLQMILSKLPKERHNLKSVYVKLSMGKAYKVNLA